MSWNMNGTQFCRIASNLGITAEPFTFAAWLNPTTRTGALETVAVSLTNGAFDVFWMSFLADGDLIYCSSWDNPAGEGAASATAFSASFNHGIARFDSSTSRQTVLNGSDFGTVGTTLVTPDAVDQIEIGRGGSGFGRYWTGGVGSVAIWNSALTDGECTSLGKGFPPRRVRPQSLKLYVPLVRSVFDWRQASTFTTLDGTLATHHRSYGGF